MGLFADGTLRRHLKIALVSKNHNYSSPNLHAQQAKLQKKKLSVLPLAVTIFGLNDDSLHNRSALRYRFSQG